MDQCTGNKKIVVRFGVILLVLLFLSRANAQDFLKPSDSIDKRKLQIATIGGGVAMTGTIAGLNEMWYSDYPKSDFHFVNDNAQWLQMDKAGHVFASYHLGRLGSEMLRWAGASQDQSAIYGASAGFAFLTAVEVLDGFSSQWGASWGDVAANAGGTALFVSQHLLWKEQRIIPKFSFHTTPYAQVRPSALGSSKSEQLFKDYNGQTYWLSANVASLTNSKSIPKWLNLAFGYGAEGMLTGDEDLVNTIFLPESTRFRQYYLSLDIDLTRIQTKSHLLKTLFSIFNTLKIPAPTLEINGKGIVKFHPIYF